MKAWLVFLAGIFGATSVRSQNLPAPLRALIRNGVTIEAEMPAPQGFKGYVGKYGSDPIPVYLLPDGKHVIVGTLYDAQGKDLTQTAFQAAIKPGLDPALWDQLGHATWFAEGASSPARVVYVFTDTECPFCHTLWLVSRPYLRHGTTQVRNIVVAVIAPESLGRGAAVLMAADPASTWRKHEQAFGHSPLKSPASIPPAVGARIESNQALLARFKANGTPVTVYRDASGKVRMIQGVPDEDTLRAIFGG